MIVAVLGVLAVVIGVTVGLVITSGGDETESASSEDSGSGASDGSDSSEEGQDDGVSGPTFTSPVDFSLSGDGTPAPGETIVLTPSFGADPGIDRVEFFVDGDLEGTYAPGDEISTQLDAGRHRLRLIVQTVEGRRVRSDSQRIVVEPDVLGNPIPDNLRAIANRYSNALANDNWSLAAQMNSSIAGSDFVARWGDIDRQFVVPVSASGNVVRLGLVVHQLYDIDTGTGGPRTSVFCNIWTIDPTTGTIVDTDAGPNPGIPTQPGYVDEYELADRLVSIC